MRIATKPVKILFLDFDGVLITSRSMLALATYPAFDPVACHLIEAFCQRSGAKIVICSAWREERKKSDMEGIFDSMSIARTHLHKDWATPVIFGPRAREIQDWLSRHPETSHYAILDDGIGLEGLEHRVVQPDSDIGILIEHIIDLCALLDEQFEKWFLDVGVKPTKNDFDRYSLKARKIFPDPVRKSGHETTRSGKNL